MMDRGDLRIREVIVGAGMPVEGKRLGELNLRAQTNVLIAAARGKDEDPFIYNPGPELMFEAGMILIALGPDSDLSKFERMVTEGR